MSVADKITRLTTARNNIRTALAAKGITAASGHGFEDFADDISEISNQGGSAVIEALTVTQNGTYTPPTGIDGYSPVVVQVEGESSSIVRKKNVNFIDYDGSIVYSYTPAEFAALTTMPANPTHTGLTAQGWNWSLLDAQAYVAKYNKLQIGQMYITDDGKTRIYIHLEKGRTSPYLGIAVNGTADVDWGDGTAHATVTGTSNSANINTLHDYPDATGDYIITINVTGRITLVGSTYGSCLLWNNSTSANQNRAYQNAVRQVEIGSNAIIGASAFRTCASLTSITIPNGATSIGGYAFYNCYNLDNITIPDSITNIGTYTFYNCCSLSNITIPNGIMSFGGYIFYGCCSFSNIIIPNGVTSIGSYAFYSCQNLSNITIPDGVTSIGGSAFFNCYSLGSITIPDSVTNIGSAVFYNCYTLDNITIPDGVTSIGGSIFQNCYSLTSITIPNSVTNIGNSAFYNCCGLGFIRFKPTTPPTIANSNVWTGISTDCIIYVPIGTLSDYTVATNYPSSSAYTYVEY